ncbi:sensor histidine kinase [Spirosoma sp. KNUC1025]|uniref:sensor histidine kinase n=1 Tax=Spirosoma sp. KNUC1025 TaxID=2894082 RepID=UPI001E5C0578|nr:ATP-binding protein [Spirosoma sp. KNUC1025]UFH57618.1 hypothetical protein LN737_30490 [Spirosoma sp. KNUC1025]
MDASSPINLVFVTFGSERRLDPETELILYRIAIELVTNALKHAQARTITVQLLFHATYLSLMVEDDGVGSVAREQISAGIGIRNVRSRANYLGAELLVDSGQSGTTLTLMVPLGQQVMSYGK